MSQVLAEEEPLEDDPAPPVLVAAATDRERARSERPAGGPPARAALERRGLFSLGWSTLSQVVTMVVRLGSTIVMTRLLAPKAYGIFGTALAVVITLEWFSDLGILPALLRHPEGDRRIYLRTGWWINVIRGTVLTLLCAALAYPLTRYYDNAPELLPVLLALSTVSVLQALRSPATPLMRRELDYRSVCVLDLAQLLVGTATSLVLAWQLRSVWAIVWGTIAGTAAATVASYLLRPMSPGWAWDRRVAAEISGLSRQILVNTLVAAIWLNADRLLGLRYASPEQMGLYAVAASLVSFLEGLALRVCDIYYSMLSRLTDPREQAAWHRKVCDRMALWGMPLLAVGVVAAPLVVRLLYDRRYAGAGVLFALLIARLMARLLEMVQFQHLLATAEVRLATLAFVVAGVAQVLFLVTLGRAYGVFGIAVSSLASTLVLTGTQSALIRVRGERCLRPLGLTFLFIGLALGALGLIGLA